jgi:hypothetical protein
MRKLLAIFLSLILDAIDFIGGFIPIAGDFIDLIGIGLLYYLTGDLVMLSGLIELVPFADFIPTFTIASIYSMYGRDD